MTKTQTNYPGDRADLDTVVAQSPFGHALASLNVIYNTLRVCRKMDDTPTLAAFAPALAEVTATLPFLTEPQQARILHAVNDIVSNLR